MAYSGAPYVALALNRLGFMQPCIGRDVVQSPQTLINRREVGRSLVKQLLKAVDDEVPVH